MDSRELDVFHNSRDKSISSVTYGISFTFHCVVKEAVDEDRSVRSNSDGGTHVVAETFVVVYHFHAAAAKYEGWTNHDGISDFVGIV